MHTVRKTKLNYDQMSDMHNLYDSNCMIKVKGATEIAREAMMRSGWVGGIVGIPSWEKVLSQSMEIRSRCA